MGDIDKFRELYSKEGDNSSRFEVKPYRGNTPYVPHVENTFKYIKYYAYVFCLSV